jgi:hypothetical protein
MIETLHNAGEDVLAHQTRDGKHRLVLCCRPVPQKVGKWASLDKPAIVEGWAMMNGDTEPSAMPKITAEQLMLLKQNGFQWYRDNSTDRVEADCIADVIPAAQGFTVLYNEKSVLAASTAVVKKIVFPKPDDLKSVWIRVYWESIKDERK